MPPRKGKKTPGHMLTCNVVDVILAFLYPVNILLEADLLVARLGSAETRKLRNLSSVEWGLSTAPPTRAGLLLLVLVSDLEHFLVGRLQLLAQTPSLPNGVLINWVNHVGHLVAILAQRSTQRLGQMGMPSFKHLSNCSRCHRGRVSSTLPARAWKR